MSEPKNCIHGVNTINFCLDCYKESRGVAPTKPQQDPMKKHVPGLGCKCEAYAAIECCCDGVDWRSSREVELEAELADLRQVAQGLRDDLSQCENELTNTKKAYCEKRDELAKWTEKYSCCDGKPDCANNKLQKLCHDLLGEDWTDKHEELYDIVASAETGEDWAKAKLQEAQEQITKLEDEKKQIVNNSIKFLDTEKCEKHFNEAKALSCAEYITAEKAAGCRMCLKQEIADLQTKLSVATKEVKVLTEIRANQAHLIKCLQSEVAELRGNVHDE